MTPIASYRPTPTTSEALAAWERYQTALREYHEREWEKKQARAGNVVRGPWNKEGV